MKILSVVFLKYSLGSAPVILSSQYELADWGFWQRDKIQEMCTFASRTVIHRADTDTPSMSVKHLEYICHYRLLKSGLSVICICDEEYHRYVAFQFLKDALELFTQRYTETTWNTASSDTNLKVPGLDELLKKYQNPEEVDKLLKIKRDLDDTKEILVKSMDQLLQRGEKLDELIQLSGDLSFQSKAFAKRSEDLNSCCVIL